MGDILTPSFTDGKAGVRSPTLRNLSVLVSGSPLVYHYVKESLKEEGMSLEHVLDGEGVFLGSDTKGTGKKSGTISLQYKKATDAVALPGHVLELVKGASTEYYVVQEDPEEIERRSVKRASPSVLRIMHPFFTGLQSQALGDTLLLTKSIATPSTSTLATNPVNHRTGSTKAYSALQSDGSALPAGVAISSSTGVITFTHASMVAGTYDIKVTALDTLAGYDDLESQNTLLLTVTA